jgi:hypothetical protein
MKIARNHINDWIKSGKAVPAPASLSERFAQYLESLPWGFGGMGLDWSRIAGIEANLAVQSHEDLLQWLRLTALAKDDCVVFCFGRSEPCLVCDIKFGIGNVDAAFWGVPGRRYLFGANWREGNLESFFEHFAEYDGMEKLMAAKNIGSTANSR